MRCYETSIACPKGAEPKDERAHGCGMGGLPKIFGTENLSVATLCVAMKKPIACLKGAKPKDEPAHACGMDCLPKCFGLENLWVVILCAAIRPRSLARRGPSRTMNAPMAAFWDDINVSMIGHVRILHLC